MINSKGEPKIDFNCYFFFLETYLRYIISGMLPFILYSSLSIPPQTVNIIVMYEVMGLHE